MRPAGFLFLVVAVLLLAGAGRLAQLQYTEGGELQRRAVRQQTATTTIPAQRGDVFDTQGRLLAGSVRRPSVFADPGLLEDPRDRHYAAYSVAPVLGLDPQELETLLEEGCDRRFVWIKRQISPDELATFNEMRQARRLYSFGVQYESVRLYPHGSLAAHVLGFVGAAEQGVFHGLGGIEQAFDEELMGTPGLRQRTVDARRRGLRTHAEEYVPPRDGSSIVLTLDVYIQEQTERHLRDAVETFAAEWGTAVVVDPLSGEVLAMATVPGFDPGEPMPAELSEEQARARLRNRAVADAFEPGSVFKPFVAACALEDGLIHLDEVFEINGPARRFGGRTVHDTHAYGALPVHEIISRSSNIGMSLVGGRCGNQRLNEYVRRYGFGAPTGVGLPGEHGGLVQDFGCWTAYSTQSVPIGQEVAVTAVQIAAGFSVFANGGVLYQPRIVRGVVGSDGAIAADMSEPVVVRRVLSEQTVASFRQRALVDVVNSPVGTGKQARIPGYLVFGKTGTAQVARPDGAGYLPGAYVGSFVGGAPAGQPRVVAVVSLYKPAGGKYYGGTVSAPAVAEIIADTLAYMRAPPEVTSERDGRIMACNAGW